MGYGVNFMNFRGGRIDPFPRDSFVDILTRHGCRLSPIQEGINHVGLPHGEADAAVFSVGNGEVMDFGLDRPQATEACRALLFALVHELGLTMFPDHGGELYVREGGLAEIPADILSQASHRTIVRRPEDCGF